METALEKLDQLIGYGEYLENDFVRIMATQAKEALIKDINVNYTEL